MTNRQYLMSVGMVIRRCREDDKMSIGELSKRSKVSKGNLSKIENGANFTISTLCKIARELNTSASNILYQAL